MHWRGRSPRAAKLIEQRTRALFEPLAQMEGLALLEFESGLELRVAATRAVPPKRCLPKWILPHPQLIWATI